MLKYIYIIELFSFYLPALLPTLKLRLFIVTSYFIAHISGLQHKYKRWKNKIITK